MSAETGNSAKTKICFGIKKAENHERPDLGSENMEIFNKYGVMAI